MLQLQHISSNSNPMPNSTQFLNNSTIAYCFRDQVGLYDIDKNKVILNLNLNINSNKCDSKYVEINRANCVCCIVEEKVIVVGYDDGHIAVYGQNNQNKWDIFQILKQQAAITFIQYQGNTLITNNINAELFFYQIVKIGGYKQGEQFLKQFDTLKFPLSKILESVSQIDHKGMKMLFVGGIDQKIHCYTRQTYNSPLVYRFCLSGHQNSLTKLSITKVNNDYLLASASKDGYIRLWRITEDKNLIKFHKNVKNIDSFYCYLDAVLISHESSVTGLKWVNFSTKLQLVSCSLDCTICVWGVDQEGGAWGVDARMGQFLGNKNAYFSVIADSKYQYLVAINYIGSALIWQYNRQTSKFSLRPSFNGHSNIVKDLDWDHSGNFLVSVSKDQTTRIIARSHVDSLYHEISRAQVHGYDINSVSLVKVNDGLIDLIACGADQKVIRIIQPPAAFANYVNAFTKANLKLYFPNAEQEKKYIKSKPQSQILEYETYAQGGTQVLGLMTKIQHIQRQKITSYYDDEQQAGQSQQQQLQQQQQQQQNSLKVTQSYLTPPHDDYLLKHTLWPQMNKLYGHPHQISTLAKNNSKKLLASACQGKNKISCNVIVWSTQSWKIIKIIEFHVYTVYGIQWDFKGKYLVTVGKDRKMAVFNQEFQLVIGEEIHARAIMCVAWSPNSELIVTGSRDKTIKIHNITTKSLSILTHTFDSQVSALSFCNDKTIAVGCHDGSLHLVNIDLENKKIEQIFRVNNIEGHTKPINRIRYNSIKGVLATCGQDHSVRVFKANLN